VCAYASELWSLVLSLFGVQWVMLCRVIDLLACWNRRFNGQGNGIVWNAVPLCVMWMVWRESNSWAFEGIERTTIDLKMILLRALFDWMVAWHSTVPISLLDFIDGCSSL
jgi:hypothetical protein